MDPKAKGGRGAPATNPLATADSARPVEPVKVRVIADTPGRKINDIAELTPDEATAAVLAGWADAHPDAVAYAEGLAR